MNHNDHVALLREGVAGSLWADLGSGTGAFTLALADLLGTTGTIYSVDQDARALREQARALQQSFPAITMHYLTADFTRPLTLPLLDGIVMANALHFVPRSHQVNVLRQIRSILKPGGRLILVEYNVDQGNRWVPYPLSYRTAESLTKAAGFASPRLLKTVPSRFLTEFYAALCYNHLES